MNNNTRVVYKIVVDGMLGAGKSTFIRTISEIDAPPASRMDQVPLDFGRVTIGDNEMVYLFGTPNGRRFDFMWETLRRNLLGTIFVVDATRPDRFLQARHYLAHHEAFSPVPYLVAVNRVGHSTAWTPEEIRYALLISEYVPVIGCEAVRISSVRNVMIHFLEHVATFSPSYSK